MEIDKIIRALNKYTRSPRKDYGAEENFEILMQRISPQKNKLRIKRYFSIAAASVAIMFVVAGSAFGLYKLVTPHTEIAIEENIETKYPNLNTKKKIWYFENVDITKVLSQLSEFYQIEINIRNYNSPRNIRAEFSQDDDIYNIISIIMFAAGCEYTIENEHNIINIFIEN